MKLVQYSECLAPEHQYCTEYAPLCFQFFMDNQWYYNYMYVGPLSFCI